VAGWLQQAWYQQRRPPPALWLLLPLHGLFVLISALRRVLYRAGWLRAESLQVPVVVVGNLIAGGAGKTPTVIALAAALQARGRRPAIISRGYGGAAGVARPVLAGSSASEVGDEPLLLARKSGVPVWVGRDRVAAARALLAAHPEVDVLIADDGLQHYRLARGAEVVVFDRRGLGNGWRLPLGPLREPLARVCAADAIVCNGEVEVEWPAAAPPRFAMALAPGALWNLNEPKRQCQAGDLLGCELHAVAGIGDPSRFFATLAGSGLQFTSHPFPDHHAYRAGELDFGPGAVLLMTEKDAVKCAGLTVGEAWVLPVEARLPPALPDLIMEKINGRPIA